MAYGILVWIATFLTQVQEPAPKQAAAPSGGAAKPATQEETAARLKEARRPAQRPLCRSRGKTERGPRGIEEGINWSEPGIACDSRPRPGRLPG